MPADKLKYHMYCDRDKLAELIRVAQDTGDIPSELISLVYSIADGVWYRCRQYGIDREDHRQNCAMLLLVKLPKIDTQLNCFAYLTEIFINSAKLAAKQGFVFDNLRRKFAGVEPKKYTPPPAPASCPKEKKCVRTVTFSGKTYTVTALAEHLKLSRPYIYQQLLKHNNADEAFAGTRKPARSVIFQGAAYSVAELATHLNAAIGTVYNRLKKYGGDADRAFAKPIARSRKKIAPVDS